MALFLPTSFGLYLDSDLTQPYTGLSQLAHNSDLSDNPQDFVFYLGSVEADRVLYASSSQGIDPITLTPTDTMPEWLPSTAYAEGDLIEPTVGNGRRYRCVTAGTSGSTEPTWPTTGIGSTVPDGTCLWKYDSFKHEISEVKLALTSGGLASATAGGPISLGTSILSGTANAIEVHMRVENAVTTIGNNTGTPAIKIYVNSVIEKEVV